MLQAASLDSYFLENQQADVFNTAWRDAISRGKGWQRRARQGMAALLKLAPELSTEELWRV